MVFPEPRTNFLLLLFLAISNSSYGFRIKYFFFQESLPQTLPMMDQEPSLLSQSPLELPYPSPDHSVRGSPTQTIPDCHCLVICEHITLSL